jgi:hypothetical protein
MNIKLTAPTNALLNDGRALLTLAGLGYVKSGSDWSQGIAKICKAFSNVASSKVLEQDRFEWETNTTRSLVDAFCGSVKRGTNDKGISVYTPEQTKARGVCQRNILRALDTLKGYKRAESQTDAAIAMRQVRAAKKAVTVQNEADKKVANKDILTKHNATKGLTVSPDTVCQHVKAMVTQAQETCHSMTLGWAEDKRKQYTRACHAFIATMSKIESL